MQLLQSDFYSILKETIGTDEPFVLCTVIETEGSSPGKPGQKMIVFKDGSAKGTVGGGPNELMVIKMALEQFDKQKPVTIDFDMSGDKEELGICGGKCKIFLELISPALRFFVFGAGHVGKNFAEFASLYGFNVTVIDNRDEFLKDFSPKINTLHSEFEDAASKLDIRQEDYALVVTPEHSKDYETVASLMPFKPKYLGLVGSARKKASFKSKLQEDGFAQEDIAKLHVPAGIYLGGKTPADIAIEIMAQIVAFKNGKLISYNKN